MAVLLLAEIVGGEISIDQTGKALTAVQKLGDVTLSVSYTHLTLPTILLV